jgi:hypothetical protein
MHYTLQFDGSHTWLSIIKHGPAIPLLLIDGMVINRIPLRMKQLYLFQIFFVGYLTWTVAYSYSGLSMPDGEVNIYEWLDWKTDIHSAVLLSLFVLVLVNPAVFVLCRSVSRILPRRLKSSEKGSIVEVGTADVQDEVDMTQDIEEGDVTCDEENMNVILSDVTVDAPYEHKIAESILRAPTSQQDEDIEDLASFPEIIYDDGDAAMSLDSSYNEDTHSSRFNACSGDIETKKTSEEDLASFPDENDADYSFDKEGVDISFERDVSKASLDVDLVSFPDLLPP